MAKALAKEGAMVFVTGRRLDPVKTLATDIVAAGGKAEAAEVDPLDGKAVNDCVNDVVRRAGTLDVSFNAIGLKDRQDVPLIEMTLNDFVRPVRIAMETQFITSTAGGADYEGAAIGCHPVLDRHSRRHRLPECRRIWSCLLRHRRLLAEPGV